MQAVRLSGTICASLLAQSEAQLGAAGTLHKKAVLLGARPSRGLSVRRGSSFSGTRMASEKGGWMEKLGFGARASAAQATGAAGSSTGAQSPDDDVPAPGHEFATFGAGCFWGVELAFQRVHGVSHTEVGYTQGHIDNPDYYAVCSGDTGHSEVVRLQYDPKECSYNTLLDVFWKRHDPTTLNRQGNDRGTQYRSGIYFYSPEQEKAALESKEQVQKTLSNPIVTEILPAKKFYRAEEYHQQYLAKGGRGGNAQSPAKGCTDPIRCYG
jgi:peptide-methionine (S)-S-oxide reductase